MENLNRIKGALADAGKTGVWLAGQLGKDPVTDSKWCKNTIGSGDRYLNHLNTIKKWHAKQERIQIAESITPTAHLMNSSPTRSINIFKTETNQGPVHWTLCPLTLVDFNKNIIL